MRILILEVTESDNVILEDVFELAKQSAYNVRFSR